MAASLARAQGTQRQFLMSVSHDLRTPLTSIRGFAEALSDGATTDVTYAAGVIGSSARRLERLVTDLLELAKLESGAFSLHCGPLDLSDVVSQAAQAFEPAASRPRPVHRAARRRATGEVLCVADPDRVGQVVANLVENALKYATSRVTVSTGRLERRLADSLRRGRRSRHPLGRPGTGLRKALPVTLAGGPRARFRPGPGDRGRACQGHGR